METKNQKGVGSPITNSNENTMLKLRTINRKLTKKMAYSSIYWTNQEKSCTIWFLN
jgi:hypothetical protein